MRVGRIILLFNIMLKSKSGDADLFSTNMNNINEIIPAAEKPVIVIVELLSTELLLLLIVVPISKYVITSRNDIIATASVMAPFTSRRVLLVTDLLLFDIVLSLSID